MMEHHTASTYKTCSRVDFYNLENATFLFLKGPESLVLATQRASEPHSWERSAFALELSQLTAQLSASYNKIKWCSLQLYLNVASPVPAL